MKQGCSSDCYYAPKKLDDPQGAEKEEMKEALLSRDEIYDLAFTLPMQYFKTGDGVSRLSVVSHIGLKDLRFRMADGKHYNEWRLSEIPRALRWPRVTALWSEKAKTGPLRNIGIRYDKR